MFYEKSHIYFPIELFINNIPMNIHVRNMIYESFIDV